MASNIDIIVGATVDGALGGLRAVDSAINKLQPAAAAVGAIGKAAFAAVSAAVAGSVAALVSFTMQASEAEQVLAKFESIVGSSALADYSDEMIGLADALSQVTRFEDEAILSAETQLALYENIGQDVFPQVIATALDLAEALGVDAVSGAETLGRALADIEGGSLSLLKRQKLLTDEQVKTAEAMAEAGDTAGAQAYILDILDGKIGDLAETMGKTFSGQMTILKNNLGNLAEEIGGKLLPVLAPVVEKIAELVEKYGPMLSALFDKAIIPGVKKAVAALLSFIDTLTSGNFNIKEWLLGMDWAGLGDRFVEFMNNVDWNAVGNAIGEGLKIAFEVSKSIVTEVDWSSILSSLWEAIEGIGEGISEALGGGNDWDAMWEGIFGNAASIAENAKTRIVMAFGNIPTLIGAIAGGMMSYWTIGILSGAAKVIAAVKSIATKILTIFRSIVAQFKSVGKAMLDGIRVGIESGFGAFSAWLSGIVQSIIDAVLATLGISSPSKVFANIGKQMMAGMAQGIARNVSMPMTTMQMATAGVVGASQTQNNYYYGRILMQPGNEGQLLNTLLE